MKAVSSRNQAVAEPLHQVRKVAVLCACAALAFLIGVSLAARAMAEGPVQGTFDDGQASYEYTIESGEATIERISKAEGNTSQTYEAVVPEKIANDGVDYLVTSIGEAAIDPDLEQTATSWKVSSYNTELTRLVLPSKLLSIGPRAFAACSALTSVEFSVDEEGLTHLESIGDYAFFGSTRVGEWLLPDSVLNMGTAAIQAVQARKVKLPATQTNWAGSNASLGTMAACTELVIPEGCVTMPVIFASKLESLRIPSTVKHDIHLECRSLKELNFAGGMQCESLTLYASDELHIVVPEGVRSIALHGGDSTLELPDTLQSIVEISSTKLASITIPASVTNIENYAFANDTALEQVKFAAGSQVAILDIGCFQGCTSLSDIELPDGLLQVSNLAFENCDALESVTLPSSIRVAGGFPFSECDALREIRFAPGVGYGAGSLTAVQVNGLAKNCPNLERVVFPTARVSLGSFQGGFISNCLRLSDLYFYNPDQGLSVSYFPGCGVYSLHCWGAGGALVDFAEDEGLGFVPYAELDDAGYNGASNVTVSLGEDGCPVVTCSFTTPVNYDYRRVLAEGADYAIEAVEEGAAWKLTGIGPDCFGSMVVAASRPLSSATMNPIGVQVLTGSSACRPNVTVRYGDEVLVPDRDYTLSYEGNDRAGTARAVATAVPGSGYVGELVGEFSISERHELTAVPALSRADAALAAVAGAGAAAPASCEAVVVAWAFDSADVALGSALAAAEGAQLLCVSNSDGLTVAQLASLNSWGATRAYVVGGAPRCGKGTVDALAKAGVACTPVGQGTATNAALSAAVAGASRAWGDVAVACNPAEPAVCASAAAYAAAVGAPLVFTLPDGTFDAASLSVLASRSRVVVVGDVLAVDSSVESALAAGPGVTPQVERIGALGDDSAVLSRALAAYARRIGAYSDNDVVFSTALENASANTASALVAGRVKGEFLVK